MKANILGMYLKRKRVERAISQMAIAEQLGYNSAQYISNFERGLCQPSAKILPTIAEFYELDREELLRMYLMQAESDIQNILYSRKARKPKKRLDLRCESQETAA